MWSYSAFSNPSGCGWPYVQPWYPAWPPPGYLGWSPLPSWPPQQISANTAAPSAEAVVGGAWQTGLSLEFQADSGAASPSVKITLTDTDGSSEVNIAGFPAGSQVRRDVIAALPGAKLKLEVAGATATLSWFEFGA